MSATQSAFADIERHCDSAWRLTDQGRSEYVDELTRSNPALAQEVRKRLDHRTKLESQHRFDLLSADDLFIVEREIGRGATSTIYRAQNRITRKTVAVKVPHSPVGAERFLAEANAATRLDHPAIARVYDCGIWRGKPYLAIECIEGRTLEDHRDEYFRNFVAIAELLRETASGLGHAHSCGVIHRDLKPRNILVTNDGHPKIIDFGCAKASDSGFELTATGDIIGTPRYMAPEQATGQSTIGPAADVFALGLILYELLTGQHAFKGGIPDLFRDLLHEQPLRPKSIDSRIPYGLEAICLKCLEKDPLNRYPDGNALAAELQCYLNREPITARRFYRLRYTANKMRKGARASLALGLVIAVCTLPLLPLGYAGAPTIKYWWGSFCDNSVNARRVLVNFPLFGNTPAPELLISNDNQNREKQIAREKELFETYRHQFDERMAKIQTGESSDWARPLSILQGGEFVILPDGSKKALPTGIDFLDRMAEKEFLGSSDVLPAAPIPRSELENARLPADGDKSAN